MPLDETETPFERAYTQLVERLRRENEGLHAAMRYRAVIEQAKGILMARTGSDPDMAFRRLVQHSQRTNLKLTQVAAAVIAKTITARGPETPQSQLTDDEILHAATQDEATRHLTAAALVSAPDLEELLLTVLQHSRQLGVRAGIIALAEPDGALRLAAAHGASPWDVSAWKRLPPDQELPLCASALRREALWFESATDRLDRFPGSGRYPLHREAGAILPLQVDHQLVGILSLDWDEPRRIGEAERAQLSAVAELCARPIAELLRTYDERLPGIDFEPGHADWFRSFLEGVPTPAVLLEPRFEAGALTDLRVAFANRYARPELYVGRSLLELHPELLDGPFLAQVEATLDIEGPRHRAVEVDVLDGDREVRIELHLASVGSLLAVSWSPAAARDAAAAPRRRSPS